MADNSSFHNPTDIGIWDLGTTQVNKTMTFTLSQAAIVGAKVVINQGTREVKTYTIGDGMTASVDYLTITLTLDGSDYVNYIHETLFGHISFFVLGDTEMTFKLKILKTFV